ncbi:sulfite exporter TauE/SafE family protein [Ornithinibacillus californiensis]|uniref:sulfite exporter TauE/SafE family protein n=1 Tax=Ornithinibacillus californiensis TaxID=161536 RepID=UPI000A6176DD|nr:sulfite exporter TauE/SafE family protein [Ornithinibacillus californiensis]
MLKYRIETKNRTEVIGLVFIICVLVGVLTAFVGSLVGLGGGVILIPILILLHQFVPGFEWASPQAIVGISLITMIFTSLSSTLTYFKKGRVDYKTGLLFLTGSIPGSVFGSWLNQFMETDAFLLYFGILIIIISMLFFLKKRPQQKLTLRGKTRRSFLVDGELYEYAVSPVFAFFLSLTVGMMSGLFGIGGGSIMVPAMILLFGFPVHIATATSMFMIFFVSVIGASTHIALGHIVWEYVLFFIPGAWIGGKLGAKTSQFLKGKTLEWVLRITLILIGVRMIINGLTA